MSRRNADFTIGAKNESKRAFEEIKKSLKSTQKSARSTAKSFNALGSIVKSFIGIQAARGIIRGVEGLSTSFLGVADTTERYRIQLEQLLGSQSKANEVFKNTATYASGVSHTYKEAMDSASRFSGIVSDPSAIQKMIEITGDLAAVGRVTFDQAAQQMVRMWSAGAGSAELFRERGILAMLGFQAGASYSAKETQKQIVAAFDSMDSKFRGTSKRLANTWGGLMSMYNDTWFQFRDSFMRSTGVFDLSKSLAKSFLDELKQGLIGNEKLIKSWGEAVKTSMYLAGVSIAKLLDQADDLFNVLSRISIPLTTISDSIDDAKESLDDWSIGSSLAGKATRSLIDPLGVLSDSFDEMDQKVGKIKLKKLREELSELNKTGTIGVELDREKANRIRELKVKIDQQSKAVGELTKNTETYLEIFKKAFDAAEAAEIDKILRVLQYQTDVIKLNSKSALSGSKAQSKAAAELITKLQVELGLRKDLTEEEKVKAKFTEKSFEAMTDSERALILSLSRQKDSIVAFKQELETMYLGPESILGETGPINIESWKQQRQEWAEWNGSQIVAEALYEEQVKRESLERMRADQQNFWNWLSLGKEQQVLAMASWEQWFTDWKEGDWKDRLSMSLSYAQSITAGLAQHSKAAFKIHQIAAGASVIMDTGKGIMKAMGDYGYPAGLLPAAAIGAMGAAQFSSINSTSFGGGGSTPSVSGSSSAIPTNNQIAQPTQQTQPRSLTLNLGDEEFQSRDTIGILVERINDWLGNDHSLRTT